MVARKIKDKSVRRSLDDMVERGLLTKEEADKRYEEYLLAVLGHGKEEKDDRSREDCNG